MQAYNWFKCKNIGIAKANQGAKFQTEYQNAVTKLNAKLSNIGKLQGKPRRQNSKLSSISKLSYKPTRGKLSRQKYIM